MDFNNCFSDGIKLAQAYVPFQELNKIYDLKQALYCGTIFPELNMPFELDNKNNTNKYFNQLDKLNNKSNNKSS